MVLHCLRNAHERIAVTTSISGAARRAERGKEELHAAHRALSLPDKVYLVIELQGIALPLIARRRPLRYYERQWPLDEEGNGGERDG